MTPVAGNTYGGGAAVGSPGAIAAQLRRAHRRPIPAAVSGIWLLAGIGAYLAGAVLVFLGPAVFLGTMDSIGTDTFGVPSGPGPQLPLFVAAAAALAGLGVTAWGMVRALR